MDKQLDKLGIEYERFPVRGMRRAPRDVPFSNWNGRLLRLHAPGCARQVQMGRRREMVCNRDSSRRTAWRVVHAISKYITPLHSRVNVFPICFSLAEILVHNGTGGGMAPSVEWHRRWNGTFSQC